MTRSNNPLCRCGHSYSEHMLGGHETGCRHEMKIMHSGVPVHAMCGCEKFTESAAGYMDGSIVMSVPPASVMTAPAIPAGVITMTDILRSNPTAVAQPNHHAYFVIWLDTSTTPPEITHAGIYSEESPTAMRNEYPIMVMKWPGASYDEASRKFKEWIDNGANQWTGWMKNLLTYRRGPRNDTLKKRFPQAKRPRPKIKPEE